MNHSIYDPFTMRTRASRGPENALGLEVRIKLPEPYKGDCVKVARAFFTKHGFSRLEALIVDNFEHDLLIWITAAKPVPPLRELIIALQKGHFQDAVSSWIPAAWLTAEDGRRQYEA